MVGQPKFKKRVNILPAVSLNYGLVAHGVTDRIVGTIDMNDGKSMWELFHF